MLAAQTIANLDGKRLAAEHVDDGQGPELLAVAQLVTNKVQAPRFIGSLPLAGTAPGDAPPSCDAAGALIAAAGLLRNTVGRRRSARHSNPLGAASH